MSRNERELRQAMVMAARQMNASGLSHGTSGNISARCGERILITPSGIPYETLTPDELASLPLEGKHGSWKGPLPPSTEWRFHLDIARARPEVGAVVHAHPTYSTVLAIARKEIPACHYMIATGGGPNIRCASYATFGTKELSDAALKALEGRACCLLANHGMIATGTSLAKAMWLAAELETIAKQYYLSLLIGGPVLLPDDEIAHVIERFKSYGLRSKEGVPVVLDS